MRENKFRAWDKKSKKMREVESITFHNSKAAFDYDGSRLPKVVCLWGKNCIEDKDVILQREPKDIQLMQFTGIKDKNGVEIYEVDIVEGLHDYGPAGWNLTRGIINYNLTSGYEMNYWIIESLEVIGNIYENPELLEEV